VLACTSYYQSNIATTTNRQINKQPNRFLLKFAEDRFAALDVSHSGRLPVVAARTFVKSVLPPGAPDQQVADAITQFVATVEGHAHDVAPEAVGGVRGVTEVTKDAFEAAVCGAQAVRLGFHLCRFGVACCAAQQGRAA